MAYTYIPPILFSNNGSTTVASPINSSATTVTLAAGTGALFPSPTSGQYFVGTFTDAATGLLTEVVWVTAVSGDTLTIVRAQESTTAQAWNTGDFFQNLCTEGTQASLLQQHFNYKAWQTHGSNSWTVPAGVTQVFAQVQGAGGGGAGANSTQQGGGGGAGGYSEGWVNVTPGNVMTAVIGQGGAGVGANATGATGGNSSFGGMTGYGGVGGQNSNSTNAGGAGGSASGGLLNSIGGDGCDGPIAGAAETIPSGAGGGSYFGTGGRGGAAGGENGRAIGSGGGGSYNGSGNGGNGADGAVILRW